MNRILTLALTLAAAISSTALCKSADGKSKLVLVAGKPSHPPRMHEFNAGVQLLAKCLAKGAPALRVETVLNGWPQDDKLFADADAIVFYMDGGPGHELVKGDGARLAMAEEWAKRGVGIGCMHYGVEVEADKAGAQFKRWIGGHYEKDFSCNPIWEPSFTKFPEHPITRGVQPFQIKDEWYFNIRFADGFHADGPKKEGAVAFTPILVAAPSDAVRNGPYVWPAGPYPHIQSASGRNEAMMWAIERADGGRGFGFTGGHFHDNWVNDQFRKTILNALVWLTKTDVPTSGIESSVTKADLDANLDLKAAPKK
jgi:type 1 glutamine amidotransferase